MLSLWHGFMTPANPWKSWGGVWMSELIGMVLSAVNVITAKLLRLPFRKALAEHPFGEQRTQV
ncbi:hypothetical protein, partial [Sphingobium cupriresistens]|uniref:hypothetical protein n=1 Tax=Sphingobium cupriresistens TaxID=1132417 RepID=UPI001A90F69E